ncbi:hypothetical protein Tco_0377481 [Tanacetum coccineum]
MALEFWCQTTPTEFWCHGISGAKLHFADVAPLLEFGTKSLAPRLPMLLGHLLKAHHLSLRAQSSSSSAGILGSAPKSFPTQETLLPSALSTVTLQDPTWNIDTCASSHVNSHSRSVGN